MPEKIKATCPRCLEPIELDGLEGQVPPHHEPMERSFIRLDGNYLIHHFFDVAPLCELSSAKYKLTIRE